MYWQLDKNNKSN